MINLLYCLQVLRGAAAVGVAFYHTGYRLAGDWHTDFNGVAIFFVISGFIMCFITRGSETDFILKRAIRIVPMYWIATTTLLLLKYKFWILWPATWFGGDHPLAIDVPRSFLFLPWDRLPVLGVGWTLNFEVYFYIVFAFALRLNKRFAPLAAAAIVGTVIWLDNLTGERYFLIHFYAHDYIHYFIYGIALFYAWAFFGKYTPPATAILCVLILATWFAMQFARPLWPAWLLPWLWFGPVVVVAAALFMESAGFAITWPPLVLIGNASYSIYLLHTILYQIERRFSYNWGFPAFDDSTVVMLTMVGLAVLLGIATHLWVEKPVLHRLRGTLGSRCSAGKESKKLATWSSP